MEDHSGHRRRLRQKYAEQWSLDDFDETSVLELLLFYSIPRADTRGAAEALLERFGSLKEVLEAPYDELLTCDGVGEKSAMLIKLVPSFAKAYYTSESVHETYLTDTGAIREYLAPRFRDEQNEICILLSLDNRGVLLCSDKISQGGRDFAVIDANSMTDILLKNGATSAVIAHNHPAGLCVPSRADTETTKRLIATLSANRIRLLDSLIYAENDCFSYAESDKFGYMFNFCP